MQLPLSLPGPSVALVGPRPYQAQAWLRHWLQLWAPTQENDWHFVLGFNSLLTIIRYYNYHVDDRNNSE